jgi:hypothetical protein
VLRKYTCAVLTPYRYRIDLIELDRFRAAADHLSETHYECFDNLFRGHIDVRAPLVLKKV